MQDCKTFKYAYPQIVHDIFFYVQKAACISLRLNIRTLPALVKYNKLGNY